MSSLLFPFRSFRPASADAEGIMVQYPHRRHLFSDRRARFAQIAWALVALALAATASTGQDTGGQQPRFESATPTAGAFIGLTQEKFAGINLARLGVIDQRLTTKLQPEDHVITSYLLGLSLDLVPDNETALRRRLQSAREAGQFDLEQQLLRSLVANDPNDTVSQLELIRAQFRTMATVEERDAAYARFLDSDAAKMGIKPEVRSRLALEAAIMLRDNGDIDAFAARLKQSLQLDPTHIDAALVAHTYYSTLISDPLGKLELLVNLVLADPLNPQVRFMIAQQLGAVGAFSSASNAIYKGAALSLTFGQQITPETYVFDGVMQWQARGPQAMLANLNGRLAATRQQQLIMLEQQNQSIDVKYITLSTQEEVLRAVGGRVSGDGTTLDDAITSLTSMVELSAKALEIARTGKPLPNTNKPATPEDLVAFDHTTRRARIDLHFARLLVNSGVETALQEHNELMTLGSEVEGSENYIYLCDALSKLRSGTPQDAIDMLASRRDSFPYAALITVFAMDALGDAIDTNLRTQLLVSLAADNPMSISGAWARTILLREHPELESLPLTPFTTALAQSYASVPLWVDNLTKAPDRFLRLTATPSTLTPQPLEPAEVVLTIQNVSDVAFGVGSLSVIKSSIAMVARSEVGMKPSAASLAPEMFGFDRRLTLMPHESIRIKVWPGTGWAGWVIDTGVSLTTRTRWRAVTSPGFDQQGNLRDTPMSLSTQTDVLRRPALDTALIGFDELVNRLRHGEPTSLPSVLAAIRARTSGPPIGLGPPTEENISDLGRALLEKYPTMSWYDRCSVLFIVPSERILRNPVIKQFDDFVKTNETDPRVLAVVVITRANFEDDVSITRALDTGDADLQRVAAAHRARLQQQRGGYVVSREAALGVR